MRLSLETSKLIVDEDHRHLRLSRMEDGRTEKLEYSALLGKKSIIVRIEER